MLNLDTKHFLTGEELSATELSQVMSLAQDLKAERKSGTLRKDLSGKTLVIVLEKPSLRTHISFHIAMTELGGQVIESFSASRKKEEPEDVARVLAGYCHGIVLRTHGHSQVERMASHSEVPVVNGLSDLHHPCQVLADLQTLIERKGKLQGLTLAYIGDGNNMLHSLLLLMPAVGIHVRYSCPVGFGPDPKIVERAMRRARESGATISRCSDPQSAVKNVDAIYTDVWTSMGFEEEAALRDKAFTGYQLNEALYALAAKDALIMHCMPMIRGKEITDSMADHVNSALFDQSENRLHAQKAILLSLLGKKR